MLRLQARTTGCLGRAAPAVCRPSLRHSSVKVQQQQQQLPGSGTGSSSRGRAAALHVVAAQKQSFTSFDDMLARSEVPLLVDFYATWCGPCIMLAPILAKVGERLKGRVQVVKIDTDKYPQIASRFRIQALPTVVLFRDGQAVYRLEGLPTEQALVDAVSPLLEAPKP